MVSRSFGSALPAVRYLAAHLIPVAVAALVRVGPLALGLTPRPTVQLVADIDTCRMEASSCASPGELDTAIA
jgi:hypothetical protein